MAGGDSLVARPRGCRPRSDDVAGYQAGVTTSVGGPRFSARCRSAPCDGRLGDRPTVPRRHGTLEAWSPDPLPDRSPTSPAPTSSSTRDGRVLYVGKAKSLRQRLNSYFQDPAGLGPADGPDGQPGRPRRVDGGGLRGRGAPARAQPHPAVPAPLQRPAEGRQELSVAGDDRRRRVAATGGGARRKRSGVRYFGPYPNVGAIRETLDLLLRSFPVRTCSDTKFRRHQRLGRPCLLYHIERCSGPCVGAVDHDEYDRLVDDLIAFLSGDTGPLETGLEAAMQERRPWRSSSSGPPSCGTSSRPSGRPMPCARWSSVAPRTSMSRAGRGRARGGGPGVPRAVGQGGGPSGPVRGQGRGPDAGPADRADPGRRLRRAAFRRAPPGAGPDHAGRHRRRHRLPRGAPGRPGGRPGPGAGPEAGAAGRRWSRMPESRSSATGCSGPRTTTAGRGPSRRSKRELGLPEAPLRIECYDMSHLQGTDYVGSMVVFEDGLAEEERVPPLQGGHRGRQRRLRGHGGGADPPAHRSAGRRGHVRRTGAEPAWTDGRWATGPPAAGAVRLPAAAAAARRRARPAPRGRAGARRAGAGRPDPDRLAGQELRGGLPPGQRRSGPAAPAVRGASTCSSGCGTRPTGSPSPTTGRCGASA